MSTRLDIEAGAVRNAMCLGQPLPQTIQLQNGMKRILVAATILISLVACTPAVHVNNKGLIEAASTGTVDEVRSWLRRGANVNARSLGGFTGSTALAEAASRGSLEMVKVLIAEGADVNAASDLGYTPLFRAGTAECVEALLAAGARPDVKGVDGLTVLEWAEKNKFEWKSKILRNHVKK